jgi:hypothetical protein
MSAHRYRLSFDYARDAAGAVLGSAKLVFSTSGGSTPLSVYTDAGLTAAATTITADSAGLFGDIFLGNGGPYRVELWNNGLTTMYWREDPVYRAKVRLYLSALPSVNWPGMEVVVSNILYERNEADTGWNTRGNVDTLNASSQLVNYETGTSYTILTGDNGTLISHGNASSIAVSLPAANATTFPNGWSVDYKNTGPGIITITPTTSTIDLAATLVLEDGQQAHIVSDGTNYVTVKSGAAGKSTIWVPANAMTPRITNGAAPGTTESTTNKVMNSTLDFDTTTAEFAQFRVAMPKGWDEGTVTFIPYWTASSGSGTVIFSLAGVALSNDDAIDTAFGTAVTSSDTLITALDVHAGPESAAITIAGTPAVDDVTYFQIARDISDTLGVDAKLIGIKLLYSADALTDR